MSGGLLIILMLGLGLFSLALSLTCISRFIFALFSPRLREKIRKEWKSHTILAVTSIALAWLSIFAFQVSLRVSAAAIHLGKVVRTANEAAQLQTSILSYYTEYSEMPHTTDNATLIKILTGNNSVANPRGIAFLSVMPRDMNDKGEMVDAWQRPFRISFADPDHPVVTFDPPPPSG